MRVLVSDTSVLIDLERGMLLEAAFRLSFELAVPDLLFKKELQPANGQHLLNLGLRVEELDDQGIRRAVAYRKQETALSLPDAFALALAHAHGWVLLTGDGALRRLAHSESVACHGVLWILDQMYGAGCVPPDQLFQGLQKISRHHRCRLPKDEIQKRLRIFALNTGAA
ncbi:hypothetical protein C7B61_00075 [filamentous cyanobacterium CCP1]|nr:hypothetical protein C7B76_32125 [filamentous cyanobacterium CCP2]PSB68570.1 hypothetical protein C7B61_00075 [filamentous cyanobacterium CCP1]